MFSSCSHYYFVRHFASVLNEQSKSPLKFTSSVKESSVCVCARARGTKKEQKGKSINRRTGAVIATYSGVSSPSSRSSIVVFKFCKSSTIGRGVSTSSSLDAKEGTNKHAVLFSSLSRAQTSFVHSVDRSYLSRTALAWPDSMFALSSA